MNIIYYIQSKAQKGFKEPTMDELREYGEKYNFPIGVSDDILGIAFSYGKHFADDGEKEGAIYCFEIFYELTDDEKIKDLIETLKQ